MLGDAIIRPSNGGTVGRAVPHVTEGALNRSRIDGGYARPSSTSIKAITSRNESWTSRQRPIVDARKS